MKKLLVLLIVLSFVFSIVGLTSGCQQQDEPTAPQPPTSTMTSTSTMTPTPVHTVVVLYGSASLDGSCCDDGNSDNTSTVGFMGDKVPLPGPTPVHCILGYTFDISSLPAGAVVTTAILNIYQQSEEGGGYATMINALLTHCTFTSIADLFGSSDLDVSITFTSDGTVEYKTYDVASYMNQDIANTRTSSQFKLQHTMGSNMDGVSDGTNWGLAEAAAGLSPFITVDYYYYP